MKDRTLLSSRGLDLGLGPDGTSSLHIGDPRRTQSFLSALMFGRRQVSP